MNASKGLLALAAVAFVSHVSSEAHASPTGLSLGLERAFGYTSSSLTVETGGVETETSTSEFTLGLSTSSARLGIDYILRSGLSFGTGFGYGTSSIEGDVSEGDVSSDQLLLAPRVGYLVMLTSDFGIWPRGGLTFASSGEETTNVLLGDLDSSRSDILLTLEAPIVIMPSQSFGFSLAPSFDMILSSSQELNDEEVDSEISGHQLGITFGVFGVL